jgi:hypothetical protein
MKCANWLGSRSVTRTLGDCVQSSLIRIFVFDIGSTIMLLSYDLLIYVTHDSEVNNLMSLSLICWIEVKLLSWGGGGEEGALSCDGTV